MDHINNVLLVLLSLKPVADYIYVLIDHALFLHGIDHGHIKSGRGFQVDVVFKRLFYHRSEEHTSELQSLMRISYAVFCLKKKTKDTKNTTVYTKPIFTKHQLNAIYI